LTNKGHLWQKHHVTPLPEEQKISLEKSSLMTKLLKKLRSFSLANFRNREKFFKVFFMGS